MSAAARRFTRFILSVGMLCGADVLAQRVPVRCYDITDGLVQNSVRVVIQDRKGFLWIGTAEGVSRFDGYQFVNYGLADGLDHVFINDIVEDRHGRLWFATNGGGVALFVEGPPAEAADARRRDVDGAANARKKFVSFRITTGAGVHELNADNVNAIALDRAGDGFWCATDAGLFRARIGRDGAPTFEAVAPFDRVRITAVHVDRRGALWFHAQRLGVFQRTGEHLTAYREPPDVVSPPQSRRPDLPNDVISFDEDAHGIVRVATPRAVYELRAPSVGQPPGYLEASGFELQKGQYIAEFRSDAAGRLWIGTTAGLFVEQDRGSKRYVQVRGLSAPAFEPMLEDRDGNVWISASGSGLCRVSQTPVVSYTTAEGLPTAQVDGVFEGRDGRIYAVTTQGFVEILDGLVVPVPGSERAPFNRIGRRIVQARDGDWVAMLEDGLLRLRGPRLRFDGAPTKLPVQTSVPGTIRSAGLYEDSDRNIWFTASDGTLRRLDADVTAMREGARASIVAASPQTNPLSVVMSDDAGGLWLANMSEFGRYAAGRIQVFGPSEGLPETYVRSMHLDRRGRLWVGLRYRGVSVTQEPRAPTPRFVNYSTKNGLVSDTVWSIAEDDFGRIYLGTGRGLDRLDPETGRLRHFSTADGLAGNLINFLLKDRAGNIWIATMSGLSRFNPRAERPAAALADIYLTGIRIAGEALPLPETGSSDWPQVRLPASRNNVVIEYVSPDFRTGGDLRYQYRLQGIDRAWSEPTEQRMVNYARLAPGSYSFEVRAIDSEGNASPRPASVTFRIDRPLWQSPWLLAIVILALVGTATTVQRFRSRQVLAMERVRRQVATDLHDDLGSGLSQIAILSEVAKRATSTARDHLDEIAGLARSMRAAMDDIVWAVDARKDRLVDLVDRMRQVAVNSLESDGVAVEFRAPAARDLERVGLEPDTRRHLLLILKEAVTNVARHARASKVEIVLAIERRELRLSVRDDGAGFDPQAPVEGQGLRSLARRAADLSAALRIESVPGSGTLVEVRMPLGRRQAWTSRRPA